MRWWLLALLGVLPLQWYVLTNGVRLHLAGMILLLLVTVVAVPTRWWASAARVAMPFVLANAALCVIWVAADLVNGALPVQPAKQAAFLAVFLAVAALTLRGLVRDHERWVRTMRWSAAVTVASLLVALSASMLLNGVNPALVMGQTIASGDPEILQKELFRTAFTGFGFDEETVRGNIRHEVFGALLVSMTVTAACQAMIPLRRGPGLRVVQLSMVLGAALLLVSMSRSVLIAAACWPLLLVARAFTGGRLPRRMVGALVATALAVVVLAASGLGRVLWIRFTQDTDSYSARDTLLSDAFTNIGQNLLTGGVETASASSHNFVLDTWLRAGVFAALAALAVVLLLLGLTVSLGVRLHREPAWMVPVTAMLLLPLVRIFTAGGGLIPPVSWVGLGLVAGFVGYRRWLLRAPDTAEERDAPVDADVPA